MVTEEVCLQFEHLIDVACEQVFIHAVVSYVQGISTQNLVRWMRMNVAEELLAKIPKVEDIPDKEFQKMHAQAESRFLSMLVKSYHNRDSYSPKLPENMIEQVMEIIGPKTYQVTIKNFPNKK